MCIRLHQANKRVVDPDLDNLINPHEVKIYLKSTTRGQGEQLFFSLFRICHFGILTVIFYVLWMFPRVIRDWKSDQNQLHPAVSFSGETLDWPSNNSLWLGALQWSWRGHHHFICASTLLVQCKLFAERCWCWTGAITVKTRRRASLLQASFSGIFCFFFWK